jgi:3D (Asp-Asp-Asp) domain-containing protein
MIPIARKSDFALVVGAILILWGPGLTVSHLRPVTPPVSAALVPVQPARNPCDNDRFPEPQSGPDYQDLAAFQVTVTGYSSSVQETDETPGLTATNTSVRQGVIALSQDMLREFTPGAPFSFHDTIEIPGLGRFQIEDTMHPRWVHRADVWFPTREDAMSWGVRSRRIYRLPEEAALALALPGKREVAATFGSANFQ